MTEKTFCDWCEMEVGMKPNGYRDDAWNNFVYTIKITLRYNNQSSTNKATDNVEICQHCYNEHIKLLMISKFRNKIVYPELNAWERSYYFSEEPPRDVERHDIGK